MADLECTNCGAVLDIAPEQRTGRCLYCASPAVVDRPPAPGRPNPSFAVGFVVPPAQALATARAWVRRPFFAPQSFRNAKVEDVRGGYLPAYLYSAAAHSDYQAEIGENYTVTETYTTTDSQGRTVTRTRTRTETEWRSLAGRHASYVNDRVVTASRGLPNAELEAVEPFDMRALRRYTPLLVSGWATEEPSISIEECAQMARTEAVQHAGASLAAFMPGDSHHALSHQTTLHEESLVSILLPLWLLPVKYDAAKPLVRLVVNGQTGEIHGKAPTSWLKVTLAVLLGLGVVGAIVLAFVLLAMVAG